MIELINQKIIPKKKTRRVWDSFFRSRKRANNSGILENSSENQRSLYTNQISFKNLVVQVDVEDLLTKYVNHNKNKLEVEINTLKLETQIPALKSCMNFKLSTMN